MSYEEIPFHGNKVRVTNREFRGYLKVGISDWYGDNAYPVIFEDRESTPYEGYYYEHDFELYVSMFARRIKRNIEENLSV